MEEHDRRGDEEEAGIAPVADAFAPPHRNARKGVMLGVLVLLAVAVVVFLVLLAVR